MLPLGTPSSAVEPCSNRLYWIDYLRSINIIGTIFTHAFLAYSPFIQSLDSSFGVNIPFVDPVTSIKYADLILLLRPLFSMQLMFFISGLFAWRSLQNRGCLSYLVNRFKRLILPLLGLAVVLMPITFLPGDLIYHRAEFHIRLAHLWFLWVLFIFDVVLVLMFHCARQCLERMMSTLTNRAIYALFLSLLLVTYLPVAQVSSQTGGWLTIFGPLNVPLPRLGLYIVYFVFGVVLGSRCLSSEVSESNLLSPYSKPYPGSRFIYLATFFACILFVLLRVAIDPLISLFGMELSWYVVNSLYVLSGFAIVISLVLLAKRYLLRQDNTLDNLASNSYGIYMLHYTIVAWIQFSFGPLLFLDAFKPWVVFLLAVPLSWVAADGIRRLPLVKHLIVSV